MTPETVVCWRWAPAFGYRSEYPPDTVNVLRRMVARHFQRPHRFICVTDQTDGLDPQIEVLPPWNDFANVLSPHGKKNPSCYRRLRMFHPEIASAFGSRFVSLDLDCIIAGDLLPVWDRDEDFVIWGDTNKSTAYNGSMIMMTAGARPKVWTRFDPQRSPDEALSSGCFGSDQGWISYCLGKGEAKWTRSNGVYSFRNDLQNDRTLPPDAKVVMFHGKYDPWSSHVQQTYPWVRRHWQ